MILWVRMVILIIMVTLWVLNAKCKAQGITKEAILCKYSRHRTLSQNHLLLILGAESLCANCLHTFQAQEKLFTLLDLCVSSLRRGHANLLCIVQF